MAAAGVEAVVEAAGSDSALTRLPMTKEQESPDPCSFVVEGMHHRHVD